ncbi:EAL domain-containing protein [Pseudomonas protegens]|jgi:diguanylate cyclase (GGDEF)-like protein/PAS domain S-box-containing protein|uniref:bifunctional diguanylate cyclase/phosphodiesterase n=1 Tax=Pseudomonas protegens TaxID=380021 RepID=UPI0023EACDAF|nr:EAL domain-containing protein [Pseudomonas protegens]MDF4206352.1 EAL domain-containing protein [Pseudomonas protegens]
MENFGLDPSQGRSTSNQALTRATLLGCSGLLLALFLFTGVLLVYIALDQNLEAEQHNRLDIDKALQSFAGNARTTLKDYALWGDAYQHLHLKVDLDWAFNRQNFGPTLYRDLGFDGVFVINPAGHTVYSLVAGDLSEMDARDWLGEALPPLVSAAREAGGKVVDRYQSIAGTPALVLAAVIGPGNDPQVRPDAGPQSVLIFVARFDPARLLALGQGLDIEHLQVARAATDQSLPTLDLPDGAGTLQWRPARPGHQLLVLVMPLLLLAGLLVGLMAAFLLRRADAAAQVMDRQVQALRANRWALAASEERFRDVAEAASDWIWEVDGQLCFTYLSERFEAVTGLTRESTLGRPMTELLSCEQGSLGQWLAAPERRSQAIQQCLYRDGQGQARVCRLSVRAMAAGGFRGTASDITEEVAARRRVEYLSQHDALTGLANRTRMQEFLEGRLQAPPTLQEPLLMLSVDLDRFKPVNDLLGHAAGDQVLHEVSQRLAQCLRSEDLVARVGGDEFVLVVTGQVAGHEIEGLCRRLIERIEEPFYIAGHEVFISASIGIARAPGDASQAEELLRFADIALYEAKAAGRSTWRFYAPYMNVRIIERRRLERDLRHAIEQDQLLLHFQPRYRVLDGQLMGAEALVRWQHPQHGLLGPDVFVPIAEDTGLILPLSNWVLHAACRAARAWPEGRLLAVKLSPAEFLRGQLVARIAAVLKQSGLEPSRLELEMTDKVLLDDSRHVLTIMQGLKALGVQLLIDDFGTGYSALQCLQTFPLDGLKIDSSFIARLNHNDAGRSIVEAIVDLGHALSLRVVAEGVQAAEQFGVLRDIQCDEVQGPHLSPPLDQEALLKLYGEAARASRPIT